MFLPANYYSSELIHSVLRDSWIILEGWGRQEFRHPSSGKEDKEELESLRLEWIWERGLCGKRAFKNILLRLCKECEE